MNRTRTAVVLPLILIAAIAAQRWSKTASEESRVEAQPVEARTSPKLGRARVLASTEAHEEAVVAEPKQTPDSPEMIRLAETNREKRIVANIERLEASVVAARQTGNQTHEQLLERRIAYLQGELESPTE